jgi:hypothetical protein
MLRFTDSVGRSSCPASPGVLEAGGLNAQQSAVDGLQRAYSPIFRGGCPDRRGVRRGQAGPRTPARAVVPDVRAAIRRRRAPGTLDRPRRRAWRPFTRPVPRLRQRTGPGPGISGSRRVLHSGTAELQSLATTEATAAGLPVIAADAMALPHLVQSRVNGLLYQPRTCCRVNGRHAARSGRAHRALCRHHRRQLGSTVVGRARRRR